MRDDVIHVINEKVVVTALISGVMSYVLLLLPFVLYVKFYNESQNGGNKTFIEAATTTFFIQLMTTMALLLLVFIASIAVDSTSLGEYSLRKGMALFYGYVNLSGGLILSEGSQDPWDFWPVVISNLKDISNLAGSMNESLASYSNQIIASFAVVVSMAISILWFACLAIPLGLLLGSIFYGLNSGGRNGLQENADTTIAKASKMFMAIIFSLTLALLHTTIASAFVSTVIPGDDTQFSFVDIMQKAWRSILE